MTDFVENDLIIVNPLPVVTKKKVNLILPNDTTTVSIGVGPERNTPTIEIETLECKYTGDMYAEKKHGKGILSYSDGRTYRGAFFADKRHGFGDYDMPNKSEFKGLYCHDERFGPGILLYKSVDIADVGLWLSEFLVRLLYSHPNLRLEIEITDKRSLHSKIASWYSPEEILTTISNSNFLLQKRSSTFFCKNLNDKQELLNTYMDRIHEIMHDKYAQLDAYVSSIDDQQSIKDQLSKERQADIIPPNQTYEQQQLFYFINKFWPLKQRATFSIDDLLSNIRSSFPSPGPLETASLNLFECSFNGDENEVRNILMERSVCVDVCDCHGLTSLHFAVYNTHIKVINTLLDFGANVNQLNDDGLTALSLAFLLYYGNNPQQTRNLALEHSDPIVLNPRSTTTTESNSLFLSRQNFVQSSSYLTNDSTIQDEMKLPSSSVFSQLSDFQSKSSYGFRLTNHLQERIRDEDFRQKIFFVISVLLRRGADPTFSDWPLPVLALAVRSNDEQMVKLLLKKKAQVNCQLNLNRHANLTPLHIACGCLTSNPIEIIRLLLEHHADVNAQSASGNKEYLSLIDPLVIESNRISFNEDFGRTPLHIACSRDESEETLNIVKVLLEYGADPNAVCNGQTPLTLAIILGNQSLVDLLLNCERTDPATVLGFGHANALCLLLSTFFEARWTYQKRIQLIERLIAKNPKVLYPVRFGPKNFLGSCVDFGHYMFNSDTRISQTPYHALSMEERTIYGERKDLLSYMAKRFREEVAKHEDFLRLPVSTSNLSESSTPYVLSRVPSMIKDKSSEFTKPTNEFRHCATCGRGVGVHLSICKRCQRAWFCSKACKDNGWNQFHRYECKRITSTGSTMKNSPSRNRELSDFDRILTFKLPPKTLNINNRLPPVSVSKYLREKRLRDRIKSAEHPPTKTIDGIPLSINPIYRLPENYSFN